MVIFNNRNLAIHGVFLTKHTTERLDSDAPRHNVIDSHFDARMSSLTVMCYGKKFVVQVHAGELKGTVFLEQYIQFVESLQHDDEDSDEYEAMCDWMLVPCFPIFRDIAPQPPRGAKLTLQDFYHPPIYRLKLFISKQSLIARRIGGTTSKDAEGLMIKTNHLPSFPGIPRVKASTITMVPDEQSDDHWCEIPRRICGVNGEEYYFKPALDRSQYIREVETLAQVAHAGLEGMFRTSKLPGIVVSDNMKMTIGLLVQWISSIGDLQSIEPRTKNNYHAQWQRQVTETVKELHRHGIIWGDVHPGNIIIDTQMNAWVIDFGGGWVEPFLTRKTCSTVEGDLHGIEQVFEHLRNGERYQDEPSPV